MKVLLINPPVFNDIGRCKSESPPLAMLYLAGYLEKNGYPDVKVLDADIEEMSWPALADFLDKERPDIVGVGGTSYVLPALLKTAEIARETLPNSLIEAGGFGPSNEPEKVLKLANKAVNLVVIKEGEQTLLEIAKRRETGSHDFSNIAGLVFLNQEGQAVFTPPRGYMMDLDSIPWPAFHLLTSDFSKYPGAPFAYSPKYKEMLRPVATLLASRGCPHRCTFCSMGSKLWRKRNPKDIVDEAEFYKNKFGVGCLQIYDDEFVGMTPKQNEWVGEICEEMLKRNLRLPWLVQGRCSPYIDLATLKKMREAGCTWIWWGVESGSQRVLDNSIQKDITIENVYRTFGLARQAGIKSLMFIMVGFPGETKEDIKMSADLIKRIKPEDIGIHIATPFPGSKLRKYLEDHNLLDNKLENLSDYYKLDTDKHIHHHTLELTSQDIVKYHRLLTLRFKQSRWYSIKFVFKSLLTIDGWKKLPERLKGVAGFFLGWLKINFS